MKVMVVDDERDVELLFRQSFRKEMQARLIDFVFVFSGEQALEKLKTMQQPPDLMWILSDINMPGMNGLELLKAVKKLYPTLKVSMITAYSNQYYQDAMAAGADKYYTKPLDFNSLKQEIMKG